MDELPEWREHVPEKMLPGEAKAWQRIYDLLNRSKSTWQLAGKYVFKGLKRAFVDPEIRARIGEGVALDPSALLKFVPASQFVGARNVAGILDELGKSNLRFVVRTFNNFPDDTLRFRIDVVSAKVAKTFVDGDPAGLKTWRIPRVSAAMERATGVEWRFGEGTLEPGEIKRVLRAAQHAYKIPQVKEAVKAAMPKASPFRVQPHVPFTMPDLRFGVSFRTGRAAGWAHVANEVGNLASVFSFAQFLKGRNPGFIASVLWKAPAVAIPMTFAINAIVGHFKRKKARRRAAAAAAAAAEAARKAFEEAQRLQDEAVKEWQRKIRMRVTRQRLTQQDAARYLRFARYGTWNYEGR